VGLAYDTLHCIRLFARNNNLEVSGPSNVVTRREASPVPMPPVLSATVNVVFREYSDGRFVLAGYVPIGAACDGSRTVAKYGAAFNSVSGADVTLFSGAKPTTGTYMTICGAS
jgi:hypothetical protein